MNVATLNEKMLSKFDEEEKETENKLAIVSCFLECDFSKETKKCLINLKEELDRRRIEKNAFISKTTELVHEFREILNTPIVVDDKDEVDSKKMDIYRKYSDVADDVITSKQWNDIRIIRLPKRRKTECDVCTNNDPLQFEVSESNKRYCLNCSTQHEVLETTPSVHKDYDRVTIATKFAYSRIIHFQECMKQYQGKQNCKIPQEVFDRLEQKFSALGLLNESDNKHVRYFRITKEHIVMFLKQLNYANHYENANYIYYVLTGNKVDDIDYLEEKILEDFKELSSLYDEVYGKDKPKELKRKNFLNVQYILYQLLRNRNHACKLEDFAVLKTIEKKKFHDEICSHLFDLLGWNFTPTF